MKPSSKSNDTIAERSDANELSSAQQTEANNFFDDVRKVSAVTYRKEADGEVYPNLFSFIPDLDAKGKLIVHDENGHDYCIVTYLKRPKDSKQLLGKTTKKTLFFVENAMANQALAKKRMDVVRQRLEQNGPVVA